MKINKSKGNSKKIKLIILMILTITSIIIWGRFLVKKGSNNLSRGDDELEIKDKSLKGRIINPKSRKEEVEFDIKELYGAREVLRTSPFLSSSSESKAEFSYQNNYRKEGRVKREEVNDNIRLRFKLLGVVKRGRKMIAIVKSREGTLLLKEGSLVGGFLVKEIKSGQITLKRDNLEYTVELKN